MYNMQKFLIYGAQGWIGSQIISLLQNKPFVGNIETIIGQSRVDDEKRLIQEIDEINPTHVICLIGRTHGVIDGKIYPTIDYLEQKGKLVENVRDNLYSPLVLAIICNQRKIHFTHLGTGCIFNNFNTTTNQLESPSMTEEDKPNFFGSSYSIVKGFTDRIMHLFEDTCLNIRIRMPIINEHNPRNFITKITTYSKICSIENSITVLPDILPIMIDMIINKRVGTYNLTNPGTISHNEILQMYQEIVDPTFKWNNFTIEEQNKILASGRSNTSLDTTKLTQLYPNVKNIKEAVRDVLMSYKK